VADRNDSPTAAGALQLAGFLSWLAVGAPFVVRAFSGGAARSTLASLAGWLVFGVAFTVVLLREGSLGRRARLLLVVVQTAAILPIAWATRSGGIETVLQVMVAAQLPGLVGWRAAIAWVVGQTALGSLTTFGSVPATWVGVAIVVRLGFQAFGLGAMYVVELESAARRELARVNEELRAAQALLADNARLAERLRIARDLHDTLGHRLAALSLNLEAASHTTGEKAASHVATARDVTRQLLAEVRDVVGAMRGDAPGDLASALRALALGVPTPRVHLELPDELGELGAQPEVAHAVYRCVQEIVTNSVRHAYAGNLWIALSRAGAGVTLHARDDGRGAVAVRPGLGLSGMRERLEQAGGRLEVASSAAGGFELTAWLPLARPAA
jgi:signal transduction histidine kinase